MKNFVRINIIFIAILSVSLSGKAMGQSAFWKKYKDKGATHVIALGACREDLSGELLCDKGIRTDGTDIICNLDMFIARNAPSKGEVMTLLSLAANPDCLGADYSRGYVIKMTPARLKALRSKIAKDPYGSLYLRDTGKLSITLMPVKRLSNTTVQNGLGVSMPAAMWEPIE